MSSVAALGTVVTLLGVTLGDGLVSAPAKTTPTQEVSSSGADDPMADEGAVHTDARSMQRTTSTRRGAGSSAGPAGLPDQVHPAAVEATSDDAPDCQHPYPCGDHWPESLEGPFDLAEVRRVFVEMSDGVTIEGWIGMPALPEGVEAPVIAISTPYLNTCFLSPLTFGLPWCYGGPNDDGFWEDPPSSGPTGFEVDEGSNTLGVPPLRFVERGFAVAFFNIRGTGNSGGCFDQFGPREQADAAELVDWLGGRAWSNGRVAMTGLSYPAFAALSAAVDAPPALKTVVVAGLPYGLYPVYSTPQGAIDQYVATAGPPLYAELSQYPDPFHPERVPGRLRVESERVCPEFARATGTATIAHHLPDRDEVFWLDRQLLDRFDDVTASALLLTGFDELPWLQFHGDEIWSALERAPKRQVEGQWGHMWPSAKPGSSFGSYEAHEPAPFWNYSFEEMLYDWFDFWLKGIGPVPDGLGTVDYEDDAERWRRTASWPPVEAEGEALYLAGDSLAAQGESGSRSYSTAMDPVDYFRQDALEFAAEIGHPETGWWAALCPSETSEIAGNPGVVYTTEALNDPAVMAGNPYAWVHIISDQPGGIVDARLIDVGPEFDCDDQGRPMDVELLTSGAADLRFHRGNFVADDLPTGVREPVRIDWPSVAVRLERSHRLALVLSPGEGYSKYWSSHFPTIEVLSGPDASASHIVVPMVEGSIGGVPAPDAPRPRPFSPQWWDSR